MQFVIQEFFPPGKHDQRRYYLRLEKDDALRGWAVPKGLPAKGKNHLAIEIGSIRLQDGGFEGLVEKSQFGPGKISVWDQGTYQASSWSDRKIVFKFSGSRTKGDFTLVRFPKAGPRHWLLSVSSGDRHVARSPRKQSGSRRRSASRSSVYRRKEWPDKGGHEIDVGSRQRPGTRNRFKETFKLNKSSFRSSYGPRDWLLLLALVVFGLLVLAVLAVLK